MERVSLVHRQELHVPELALRGGGRETNPIHSKWVGLCVVILGLESSTRDSIRRPSVQAQMSAEISCRRTAAVGRWRRELRGAAALASARDMASARAASVRPRTLDRCTKDALRC